MSCIYKACIDFCDDGAIFLGHERHVNEHHRLRCHPIDRHGIKSDGGPFLTCPPNLDTQSFTTSVRFLQVASYL